jgi:hypothetical protein
MDLQLQNNQVKQIRERAGLIYVFSVSGVDIYRRKDWQRIAWAVLAGCRGGAVNDLGVWLATAYGIWHLPHGVTGAASSRLALTYTDASATALQSADVLGMDADGSALLVATAAGVDYLPILGEVYRYTAAGCPGACAIGGGRIAYAVAAGLHLLDAPAADWTAGDATVLTAAGSPAILSDTVRALAWGTDLFIGTAAGLNIYDPVAEALAAITTVLGTVLDVRAISLTPGATAVGGFCAVGTSDGANGGQFSVLELG